jgi:hypothetical protein
LSAPIRFDVRGSPDIGLPKRVKINGFAVDAAKRAIGGNDQLHDGASGHLRLWMIRVRRLIDAVTLTCRSSAWGLASTSKGPLWQIMEIGEPKDLFDFAPNCECCAPSLPEDANTLSLAPRGSNCEADLRPAARQVAVCEIVPYPARQGTVDHATGYRTC